MILSEWIVPMVAMLAAGLAAGFAGGLFGIGGGFVVVPALVAVLPLLGASKAELMHVAVGTSLATIVATSIRSVTSHAKRDAVDFALLRSWAPWVVLGVGIGVVLAAWVSGDGLTVIFGAGMLLMGLHFLFPLLAGRQVAEAMPGGVARIGIAGGIGAFSSLLGIGGGTPSIIVMTLHGKSIHRAIATASGVGTIIAIPGALGFIVTGWGAHGLPVGSLGYVNIPAAAAIMAMSVLSAPWGVAAAHWLSPVLLRRIFGVYLLVIGGLMVRNGLG
ncbi:sulfite exporter TauE/SafE family protein [Stakelama tenebrarum]|uniref:Probable membrane transporter protein n=1 Tax=Stakelama tenebrarum TaxID=2711215 RepID=A0A6G6Y6U6_9SPHN|nr:sulfite exporter TauE/SafE family protein [Sphingosinithalassobacter tenebrarum]QIG80645.1 sulfite exporter TauE/SafE family protein [Sphingosinithalassobacter tenebrarum]